MAASKVLTRRGRGALRHRGRHGSARFGRVPRAVGERGGRAPAKAGRFWRLEARAQAVEPLRTRLVPAPPKTKDGEYSEDGRSYLEEYVLGDCETIEGGELVSPVVITKIIESLAIGHFQKLSGDQSDVPRSKEMKELDLTFMLSRITFAFKSLPASDHQVQAETCFKPQKVSFKRDFAVRNTATGAIVAAATSTYVLVNFKTRKLSVAPKEMVDLSKDYNTKNSAEKLGTELPKKSKLPTFTLDDEEAKPSTTYVVEDTDIDLNGHVGASVYIHWILDSAEAEEMTLDSLTTLDIEYKQECFLNERIECYTQKSDSGTNQGTEINHLIQTNEGKVLLRAKSVWN